MFRLKRNEPERNSQMRTIGIRHRRKRTTEGEARPTQIVVQEDGKKTSCDLPDDNAELAWVLGNFRKNEKSEPDGLRPGDTVAMLLGGSGDRLAFALSRRAETIGAKVLRVPAFRLDAERDKDQDAALLAELTKSRPELFCETGPRDRDLIWVVECYRARQEAMKARIACEQRLLQTLIGRTFCNRNGQFPEGSIELAFEQEKASNAILANLTSEEKTREKELVAALEALDVYTRLFVPIKGVGPMIAARLIMAIQDIRRFEKDTKFKAFCGVHVLTDGKFARRRHNEVANWHPDARQALYLLGDQFNRRPDTPWGQKLREYKARLRQKHPKPEVGPNGKKRYSDGHIHKMALWRTLTKFVEWMYKEWWKIERQQA
jgi:hypothetical protein